MQISNIIWNTGLTTWNFIWKSPAIRQSVVVTFGTTATAIIMAIAMIVASRFLGPEQFGVFSVSIAIMSFFAKVPDAGFNQLIPRLLNRWHDDPQKSRALIAHLNYWKLYLSLILLLCGLLLVPFVAQVLRYPHESMIVWAVLGGLGLGLYEYLYLILSARHQFVQVSVLSIAQALLKAVGFLLVFWFKWWPLTWIAAVYYLTPLLVAVVIGLRNKKIWFVWPRLAGSKVKAAINRYLGHAAIGIVAMTIIGNIDILFVQRELNLFDAGVYAGASRIALFIGFVTASFGGVLNNRVSRYRDKKTLKKYLLKSLILTCVAVFGFVVYLPLARQSLLWTIGPDYLSGLPALIVLVGNAFLSFAVVPYIAFFYAVDHPRYFSVGGVLQAVIIIVGNALFLQPYGIVAAAWSRTLATIAFGFYTMCYVLYAWSRLPDHDMQVLLKPTSKKRQLDLN